MEGERDGTRKCFFFPFSNIRCCLPGIQPPTHLNKGSLRELAQSSPLPRQLLDLSEAYAMPLQSLSSIFLASLFDMMYKFAKALTKLFSTTL